MPSIINLNFNFDHNDNSLGLLCDLFSEKLSNYYRFDFKHDYKCLKEEFFGEEETYMHRDFFLDTCYVQSTLETEALHNIVIKDSTNWLRQSSIEGLVVKKDTSFLSAKYDEILTAGKGKRIDMIISYYINEEKGIIITSFKSFPINSETLKKILKIILPKEYCLCKIGLFLISKENEKKLLREKIFKQIKCIIL